MRILDEVLEFLKEEQHAERVVEQIMERFSLSQQQALAALNFLANYQFIEMNGHEIRITPTGLKLLQLPSD